MMTAPVPRLFSLAAFLKRPRPRWLVDGLLPAGEMAVLFGAYGSCKSFVALELAGCVSQGRKFAGRSVRRGKVLVLIAEGCDGVRDRFDIMEKEGRVHREDIFICDSACQIGNATEREALLTALSAQDFHPDFIVVDTLARHAVGVEENNAKDMGVWIDGVDALAQEFGCTVLLVHHAGKSERRGMRGSSALSGAISTAIACNKQGNSITLTCDKQKDADEFKPIKFRTRRVTHSEIESLVLDHADVGTPGTDRPTQDEVAILMALRAAYPSSIKRGEVQRANGSAIPDTSFDRAIKQLIAHGRAERIGQGEYLLCKSPSPNDPQESPPGVSCTPEKSPPAPPPYRVGGVRIGAEVEEVKNVAPSMSSAAAVGGYLERIEVPTFTELNAWPLPNQRCKEWFKH